MKDLKTYQSLDFILGALGGAVKCQTKKPAGIFGYQKAPLGCNADSALEGLGLEAGEILKLGGHPDADMRQSWHKLE